MAVVTVTAQKRTELGKGPTNRLRRQGFIPGIIYGQKASNIPVAIGESEFRRVDAGAGQVFKVAVEGEGEHSVLVREMQKHPVSQRIIHVDLMEVSMDEPINTIVPVRIDGEAKGEKAGGILQYGIREVEVKCLPADIPEAIAVDISGLEIGDQVKVEDLVAPTGVTILTDPEQLVISVITAQVEEVVEEEAPEGEEPAAPEAAEEAQEE